LCGDSGFAVRVGTVRIRARGIYRREHTSRQGWFEQASSGTIFLGEIGELPLSMQAKLLPSACYSMPRLSVFKGR